jgi:hypothetical protein
LLARDEAELAVPVRAVVVGLGDVELVDHRFVEETLGSMLCF